MKKVALILALMGLVMIGLGVVIEMVDFYNDYQCSTTKDLKWFEEHNCIRYWEG